MADNQLAVIDLSGRLIGELSAGGAAAGLALRSVAPGDPADGCAVLIAPAIASDLPPPAGGPLRWIVGDGANAARLAGAAAQAGAAGVILTPVAAPALRAIAHREPTRSSTSPARAA